ncbi:MAG: homoserine dehydrogenase [Erysipelotrichaceae bacterium]|nr:homoserine dehydrogenase [Erysipelotrichaceae bacterium]
MKIAILGYGVVGKGVEQIAEENGIEVSHILMRDIDELTKANMTSSLDDIISDDDLDCIVECIGGDEPAHSYVHKALEKGKNVVTSNKKMLVKHFKELLSLAKEKGVVLLFSAACGGGIPWIKELSSIAHEEEVYSFKGIMNGTSNYILDRMYKEGLDFSVALKNAQELGYAEADPSDDIDGVDTANKVILSAGTAFRRCFKLEECFVKGIRHFSLEDLNFAKENGLKAVLLGKGRKSDDGYCLSVMPTFVKKDSVLGNIADNYNCFILDSKNLSNLVFIGQGAGSLPTASNVIRDVLSIKNSYEVELEKDESSDYENNRGIYYIRSDKEKDERYIDRRISDKAFISKPMSIKELSSLLNEGDFVGETEND